MKKVLICILILCCCVSILSAQAKPEPRLKNGRYKSKTVASRYTGWVWNHKPQGKWIMKERYTDSAGEQKWVVIEERHFLKGRQHGRYVSFTPQGDTASVTFYRNGLPYGESRAYNHGQLASVEHFDANGKITGLNTYYDGNGKLYRVVSVDAEGITQKWSLRPDGTVTDYTVGQCGDYIVYRYMNSSLAQPQTLPVEISSAPSAAGVDFTIKYEHGLKVSEMWTRDGRIDSTFRAWTNNVLTRETNYNYGVKEGQERHWTNSGKLWVENNFRNDVQHGLQILLDTATGLPSEKNWYAEGVADSTIKYAAGGTMLYRAGNYSPTHAQFTYTTFHGNGTVATSGEKNGGEESGQQEQWYATGVRKSMMEYASGKPNGAVDFWNEKGVHVFHGEAAMGFDTLPELIWSESGQSLRYGTKAYDAQRKKYQPSDLFLYSDTVFFTHAVNVTTAIRNRDWSTRGTLVQLKLQDTIGGNKRVPPRFAAGFTAQELYFASRLHYPQMELDQGKSGDVCITFVVEKDGSITEAHVAKAAYGAPGLGREAQRLVAAMPKWVPATKNGMAIRSMCVMKFVWKINFE